MLGCDYTWFTLFLPGFQKSKYPLFESLPTLNNLHTSLKKLIPIVYPIPHFPCPAFRAGSTPCLNHSPVQQTKLFFEYACVNSLHAHFQRSPVRHTSHHFPQVFLLWTPQVHSLPTPYQCYNATVLLGDSPISLPASAKLFSSPHHHLQLR